MVTGKTVSAQALVSLSLLCIAIWPAESCRAQSVEPSLGATASRKTLLLSQDVNAALRSELQAATGWQRSAAVSRLAALHAELAGHERIRKSELLQRHFRRIEFRLLHVYNELSKLPDEQRVAAAGNLAEDEPPLIDEIELQAIPFVMNQAVGRGAAGGANAGLPQNGMAGSDTDHAAELVEIISATIAPDTWESVGGQSSMRYYRQGMGLVVRAPQAVHDKLVNLLIQLRAAGP